MREGAASRSWAVFTQYLAGVYSNDDVAASTVSGCGPCGVSSTSLHQPHEYYLARLQIPTYGFMEDDVSSLEVVRQVGDYLGFSPRERLPS